MHKTKASPWEGRWLGGSRDGEVVSDLQQPFSVSFGCQLPCKGSLAAPQEGNIYPITTASSIDGSRSKATSYKFDTPVSGGAYQDAREVTIVWNDA